MIVEIRQIKLKYLIIPYIDKHSLKSEITCTLGYPMDHGQYITIPPQINTEVTCIIHART